MRAAMLGTIIMTFLSGATSGYLIGHTPPPPTWIDQDVLTLEQKVPEISAADLAKARTIYEDHERRIMELKSEAEDLLGDQILRVKMQSKKKILAIMDSYGPSSPGPK
jgi:hypothetical protein